MPFDLGVGIRCLDAGASAGSSRVEKLHMVQTPSRKTRCAFRSVAPALHLTLSRPSSEFSNLAGVLVPPTWAAPDLEVISLEGICNKGSDGFVWRTLHKMKS